MEERLDKFISYMHKANAMNLRQYAYNLTHDWHWAEDLVQQTFYVFILQVNSVIAHPNPAGWLYKTLYNIYRDEQRKKYRSVEIPLNDEATEFLHSADPQSIVSKDSLFEFLPTGLREAEKQILQWYLGEQYSYKTIAKLLKTSETACRTRVSKALKKCKKLF